MSFFRSKRKAGVLVAALFLVGVLIWVWGAITPTTGEPYTAAKPSGPLAGPTDREAPPEKLWSFGFVGDTHAGLNDGTIDAIFSKFEEADLEFVLHLGDMVDVGAADSQWDQFSQLAWKHRVRLMPVVGNHDPHRGYPSDRGEIRIRQYFPQLPETFYSFHHRGLCFLMLNSERSLLPGTEQATFLHRQLARQPLSTIVCLHRPVFTCSKRDLPNLLGRRFCLHRVLRDSSAVCVLTGHNHYYERTKPLDGVTYLVSGGGSANQYGEEKPNKHTAKFVSGRSHYGLVDVFADHLQARLIDLEGELIDSFDLPIRSMSSRELSRAAAWSRELPPIASLRRFDRPTENADVIQTSSASSPPAEYRRQGQSVALPLAW